MTASELPELGVGIVEFGGLRPFLVESAHLVDFLEIEPATTSRAAGHVAAAIPAPTTLERPRVVHGVSCPVGGSIAPDEDELQALASAATEYETPWLSEHLSIDRLRDSDGTTRATGFFLPPIQTMETAEMAAERISALSQASGRPVAFETGVNYFRPQPGEMSDGAFFRTVAELADCFILCDLHNLWCNEHNGRQQLREVMAELPLDRVCEVHLAGGQYRNDMMLDAHSNLVAPDLLHLSKDVIAGLPNLKALTFELTPDYIGPAGIVSTQYRQQLEVLHDLWEQRGKGRRPGGDVYTRPQQQESSLSTNQWEAALANGLGNRPTAVDDERGFELYRHLIETMRLGAIVTVLPLTHRYLVLTNGRVDTDVLLSHHLRTMPTEAWSVEEAQGFVETIGGLADPVAAEIASFELAASETAIDGITRSIEFSVPPEPLIESLAAGTRPPLFSTGTTYEVLVEA